MDELQNFCHNETALETFYSEVLNKPAVPGRRTPYLEGTIPAVDLPPSLSLGEGSSALVERGPQEAAVDGQSFGQIALG